MRQRWRPLPVLRLTSRPPSPFYTLYVSRLPPARRVSLTRFCSYALQFRLRLLVPPWWLYVPFAFTAAHVVWRRDIRLQHSAECSAIRLCALALGCTLARLALYVCLPVPRLQRSHSALLARLCAPRWAHPHVYSLFHARPWLHVCCARARARLSLVCTASWARFSCLSRLLVYRAARFGVRSVCTLF